MKPLSDLTHTQLLEAADQAGEEAQAAVGAARQTTAELEAFWMSLIRDLTPPALGRPELRLVPKDP